MRTNEIRSTRRRCRVQRLAPGLAREPRRRRRHARLGAVRSRQRVPHAGQGRHARRVAHDPHRRRPHRGLVRRWPTRCGSARATPCDRVRQAADTAVTLVQNNLPKALPKVSCPRCSRPPSPRRSARRSRPRTKKRAAKTVKRGTRRDQGAHGQVILRYHCARTGTARSPCTPMRSTMPDNDGLRARDARPDARRARSARIAREEPASASRSPAAGRSAASTRSARCSRSPIRSTASISTTSTSTSACRRAASSPRRSPTASRRRRCTGCSSTTAPTRR